MLWKTYNNRNISPARPVQHYGISSRPQVLISRCLLGHKCRYDGEIFSFCEVQELKKHFDFITICPETELGLNSPRPPIKLIKAKNTWLLKQPGSNVYLQDGIRKIVLKYLKNFPVEGMILKEKSPTCGKNSCKYYFPGQTSSQGRAPGFLPQIAKFYFPHLPLINELELRRSTQLYYFLLKIYARFNWRKLLNNYSIGDLQKFHADYKLLLLGFSRKLVDKLGRILAGQQKYSKKELQDKYYRNFMQCLSLELNRSNWKNVILHGFGHISDNITSREKKKFLADVEKFMEGKHCYLKINEWLRCQAKKLENNYLLKQKFLSPYPQDLNKSLKECGTIPNPF